MAENLIVPEHSAPPLAARGEDDLMPTGRQTEWQGPWAAARKRRQFFWRKLLWSVLFPPRGGHRVQPTIAGVLLVAVALGIGTAAYNTQNNILFITLSLLLSCLVLSGVLSWLNLRAVGWRLHLAGPWRAGQTQVVALELRNQKDVFPTYGLWFEVAAGGVKQRRALESRLDPGENLRLDWSAKAERRGRMRVELLAVGSLFPFGFLRKTVRSSLGADVLVWPAPCEYRRQGEGASWRAARNQGRVNRIGQGADLLALRRYSPGDSPRLVHWKASARLQHLMVRQFSAEGQEGYTLRVTTDAARWSRPDQFELALSFAATLAEDLFKLERLQRVAVDGEPAQVVRRLRDVELFLDRLAGLEVSESPGPGSRAPFSAVDAADEGRGRITFSTLPLQRVLEIIPQGPRGVAALLDGKIAATA